MHRTGNHITRLRISRNSHRHLTSNRINLHRRIRIRHLILRTNRHRRITGLIQRHRITRLAITRRVRRIILSSLILTNRDSDRIDHIATRILHLNNNLVTRLGITIRSHCDVTGIRINRRRTITRRNINRRTRLHRTRRRILRHIYSLTRSRRSSIRPRRSSSWCSNLNGCIDRIGRTIRIGDYHRDGNRGTRCSVRWHGVCDGTGGRINLCTSRGAIGRCELRPSWGWDGGSRAVLENWGSDLRGGARWRLNWLVFRCGSYANHEAVCSQDVVCGVVRVVQVRGVDLVLSQIGWNRERARRQRSEVIG